VKKAINAGFRGCYELDRAGGNAKNRTMEARSRTEWAFGFNGRGSPTADPSCAVRLKGPRATLPAHGHLGRLLRDWRRPPRRVMLCPPSSLSIYPVARCWWIGPALIRVPVAAAVAHPAGKRSSRSWLQKDLGFLRLAAEFDGAADLGSGAGMNRPSATRAGPAWPTLHPNQGLRRFPPLLRPAALAPVARPDTSFAMASSQLTVCDQSRTD
jgi:hypothetical protein